MRIHYMPETGQYTTCGRFSMAVTVLSPVTGEVTCKRCQGSKAFRKIVAAQAAAAQLAKEITDIHYADRYFWANQHASRFRVLWNNLASALENADLTCAEFAARNINFEVREWDAAYVCMIYGTFEDADLFDTEVNANAEFMSITEAAKLGRELERQHGE